MRLHEITEKHDLRASTMVKMVQTLIRKQVPVSVETHYENGGLIKGKVEGMSLSQKYDDGSIELTFAVEKPGGWSKPDWTRIKPSEVEGMELKKQSDGTYLLTVPNEEWEQLNTGGKLKKHVKRIVHRSLGLSGVENRHSGV